MTVEELKEQLKIVQQLKCETQNLELKTAEKGCPKRLYDTLSSFSNQDEGGIIIFGVDESKDYKEVGVYDPQDLQKKINEQCLQMEPVIRPLLTVLEKDEKYFVSAEIPGMDITDRPCYYKGSGRLRGSYIRVGDSDEPMTEYEIYSYEAYRKKYQDDIRPVSRGTLASLDQELLLKYIELLKEGKPRLAKQNDERICELMSITRNREITLSSVMLFSPYPQAYFPQLCLTAIVVPGTQLGVQPDTRNPVLASALEVLNVTENRYSGIPTIRMEMERYGLRKPEFSDERGSFIVKLYKEAEVPVPDTENEDVKNLLLFCKTPRTRKEICKYLGLSSVTYAIQSRVMPLVETGQLKMSIPEKPKSPKQLFYSE